MNFSIRRTNLEYGKVAAAPQMHRPELIGLLTLALIVILTLVEAPVNVTRRQPFNTAPIWGRQPVLGYFVNAPSRVDLLRTGAKLSEMEFQIVQQFAQAEVDQLNDLYLESLEIIQNPLLSLEEKIQAIEAMSYNQQVDEILQNSADRLEQALGRSAYLRLTGWVENRWVVERFLHGKPAPVKATRTFQVFATRYDSGGSYTVALPDQCLKFANAGYHLCDDDGYQVGQGYSVFISYQKSTAATVLEAGPWNVDDNYWATTRDPQPRRMFADLPLGMPEAQAAYFDGYNGGKDQYGRKVIAPFGIDLARQVSIDIGLEPGKNDWIDVSFLWTEGWGQKSPNPTQAPGETQSPLPTQEVVIPIQAATPAPDGSITHVVQPGQTLIGIATVYQIEFSELLRLNNLTTSSLIFPGDRLVIRPAEPTPTLATATPTTLSSTPTRVASTARATRTPRATPTSVQAQTITPQLGQNLPVEEATLPAENASWDPVLIFIAILTAAGAILILAGIVLNRRT
ncbi:MAG: LysM peptidoglycan-binding domain-containing protein [Anaerolineales bacterium]|nr:MAG: LysM peptidoglycan-binding domain-containing protein [Anaerolineales bacterium]